MSDKMFRLMERHQKIDRLIASLHKNRFVDRLEVLRLKKLKLAVKDRLTALTRSRAHG